MEIHKTGDVFVPVGLPSVTFINRPSLDRSFKAWKGNKSKHLLIFGASKSGKTSLWKKYLDSNSVIKIPCNDQKSIIDVYKEILDHLNAYYTSEKGNEIGSKLGFLTELKVLLGFGAARLQLSGELNEKENSKEQRVVVPEVTASLISRFLKPTQKYVVLEDFHYATDDFKNLLSQELKAFSDDECQWVIVGIQHKTSELLAYNQDLHQRIAELPVEGFSDAELLEIVELEELALNLNFTSEFKRGILAESFNSASLVQNICQRVCLIENIEETSREKLKISNEKLLSVACKEIANEEKSYYEKIIKNVSYGGRSDGSTEKYKWFMKLIKEKDIPDTGLKNTEFFKYLKEMGHDNIEQSSVTTGLSYLPKLLNKLSFPSFFDYDEDTKTFYLLDKYMKFVFKWIPEMIDSLFPKGRDTSF